MNRADTHYMAMKEMNASDFETISQRCVAFRTRKAARVVTRLYDEALRPSDLKITQFTLLVAIKVAAPESITELADILGLERTTLTRNLSVLERSGLIDVSDEDKSRSRTMVVTKKGLERLGAAYPLWEEAQKKVESSLDDEELNATKKFFSVLSNVA